MATSDLTKLEVNKREGAGKQAAKQLRAGGVTPGIIYGLGKEPQSVSFSARGFIKMLQLAGGKSLIEVSIDGAENEPVVILEVQRDPVTKVVRHVDFKRLDLLKLSEFIIALQFTGIPLGVRSGGLLNIIEDSILIECLPTDLPDEIVVDVSALEVGSGLHARDLQLPPGLTLKIDPSALVVNVVAPAAEEVPVVAVEAEVAEGEEAEEGEEGEKEEEE